MMLDVLAGSAGWARGTTMRRSGPAVVGGLVVSAVLVGGGAVALVQTGGYDAMMDECSDQTHRATDVLADAMRDDLPGRASPVEVQGYCDKQPWPAVTTTTTADRSVVSRTLRDLWGCESAPPIMGSTQPPLWKCADVDGYEAEVDIDLDGVVIANVVLPY